MEVKGLVVVVTVNRSNTLGNKAVSRHNKGSKDLITRGVADLLMQQ